jgi:hypothetical protein
MSALALAGGAVLGATFGAVAVLRGSKPLHPVGVLRHGTLSIRPGAASTGVPLLDEPGEHECLVRLSRATGLPAPLPDIHGVAIRLEAQGDPADLLFAGTGQGRLTRHLLVPRRAAGRGPLTTLIPLRSAHGPLLLGLFPEPGEDAEPGAFTVRVSRPGGPWQSRGRLWLGATVTGEADPPLRFDTVLHPVLGLDHYPTERALREPAYAAARRGWPVEVETASVGQ